jgi:hypothetical protein
MKFKLHVTRSTFVFLAFVIIISIVTFKAPTTPIAFDYEYLFQATSLLFGILSGFSISILWGRQDRIRTVLNNETAMLYAIYYRSAALGKTVQQKLADLIDSYLIPQIDYALSEYESSRASYLNVYSYVRDLKVSQADKETKSDMLDLLDENFKNRITTTFHAKTRLVPYLSYSLNLLGVMLLGLIFYVREVSLASKIVTIMLSSIVFLVLILLHDLNEMHLWFNIFLETGINQIFDAIGKKRYYDWWLLKMHYQEPKPGETYRTRDKKTGKIYEKTVPKKE